MLPFTSAPRKYPSSSVCGPTHSVIAPSSVPLRDGADLEPDLQERRCRWLGFRDGSADSSRRPPPRPNRPSTRIRSPWLGQVAAAVPVHVQCVAVVDEPHAGLRLRAEDEQAIPGVLDLVDRLLLDGAVDLGEVHARAAFSSAGGSASESTAPCCAGRRGLAAERLTPTRCTECRDARRGPPSRS